MQFIFTNLTVPGACLLPTFSLPPLGIAHCLSIFGYVVCRLSQNQSGAGLKRRRRGHQSTLYQEHRAILLKENCSAYTGVRVLHTFSSPSYTKFSTGHLKIIYGNNCILSKSTSTGFLCDNNSTPETGCV